MGSGGAQKSLLSFLKSLDGQEIKNEYDIDLMVVSPKGIFMDQIPSFVNVIKAPVPVIWMGVGSGDDYLKENRSVVGLFGKTRCLIQKKSGLYNKALNEEQQLWDSWHGLIPPLEKQYDIAISYLNGYPNYYVMDKVKADKKVLWIHNEYQKLRYSKAYDQKYYGDCDAIITISQECVNSFVSVFPEYKEKVYLLENISLTADVVKRGKEFVPDEMALEHDLKLVSVGRLMEQKGFDLAIEAAVKIRQVFPDFIWLILGEGPDRALLEEQISKNGLSDNIRLIGIRENPYAYIVNADIFVQTSRFEGKSIVLDEAKILQKPIVVTAYPTVYDSIKDGVTGTIVGLDPDAIADGIIGLAKDKELQQKYSDNLKEMTPGNEKELEKYISVMM